MTSYRQTMSQALEYMYFVRETKLLERELTDTEIKRREEIAKDLDDQEFKDRYGKDWMQVKMGTATKMAKAEDLEEKASVSLAKKAEKSGISAGILKQVYNRGVAAWRTGHRPGTTPEQWGHARVNSFISKSKGTWGGADKDLAAKARGQKEEFDLEEGKMKDLVIKGQDLEMYAKKSGGIDKNDMMKVAAMLKKGNKSGAVKYAMKLDTDPKEYILNLIGEETDLDEGKMQDVWQKKNARSLSVGPFELLRGKSGVHTIKRRGEVIGDFSYDDDADNFVANMKGMKGQWTGNDIDSLFTHLQKVHKEELDKEDEPKVKEIIKKLKGASQAHAGQAKDLEKAVQESAAADARRAMRRDPDMRQRPFSKDDSATDDDQKGASKNIMMQMRKAQSLKGRFDVEFQDGKKVKIPAKMAIAVQQKYNSMRKPSDKEKFQAKVGKSYRDMLNALKEAVSPAQQAAIAISKKERGEKPKKESILDRIDRKIKENKNG